MLIFIPALVIGNFVVLNLFLALILNNFNSDILQRKTKVAFLDETSQIINCFSGRGKESSHQGINQSKQANIQDGPGEKV